MPSAEKSNTEAMKVEVAQLNEPKVSENAQKDSSEQHNGEKNPSPIQQIIQSIQNKVRNLEKRKNKLDGYMKEEQDGKELSSEQKKAVLKYEEVVSQLGISKEFCKQFQVIGSQAAKEQKRAERKAAFLKQIQETTKVREVIIIQDLLRQLKNEVTRNDFLNAQNGACLVNAKEMDVLETFSKHTIPLHPNYSNEPSFSNAAKMSADFICFVVDARNRQFLNTGFTFDKIKELFNRIQNCGYFEKDIKIVEQPAQPPKSETPQSNPDDLDSKDDNIVLMEADINVQPSVMSTAAPLATQVPNPTQLFNGGNGMMPVIHAPIQVIPQQMPTNMKTTVTAVENAFFNQMKYSQGPMTTNSNSNTPSNNELSIQQQQQPPNRYIEDFASANISFLQDSLVEQIPTTGSQSPQQKIPPSMLKQPPKGSTIQQVHQQMSHNYPPGLKLQGSASNIPVSYSQQQQQQQATMPKTQQAPQHLISKEKATKHQQPPQEPQHYQTIVSNTVQYQQQMPTNIQNLQDVEQKALNAHQQNIDVASDKSTSETTDRKENHRGGDWNAVNNQQPQIDTWNSDTSGAAGAASQGNGTYGRFNRGNRGTGSGPKYNNYRNSQQPRNSNNYSNENGNGDANNRDGSGATFFRNNERFNSGNPGRYNSNNASDRGNYNKRDNYRTGGSGRFNSSSSMGSSNPVQRK